MADVIPTSANDFIEQQLDERIKALAVCRRERVLPRNGELGGHYRAKRGATDRLLPSRMAKNEPDYPLSDRLLEVSQFIAH